MRKNSNTSDLLDKIKANPDDFIVKKRIPVTKGGCVFPVISKEGRGDVRAIVLDVETTGLDSINDEVIELGIAEITIHSNTGMLGSIDRVMSLYNQPKKPITEKITKLTGITNELVEGKSFSSPDVRDEINSLFSSDPYVIAHNAKFDRPFFEKTFPDIKSLRWSCTLSEIDWDFMGHKSAQLERVLDDLGFFYDAHRASIDCLATAWIFTEKGYGNYLVKSFDQDKFIVPAMSVPYAKKDALKDAGFKWNQSPFDRVWSKQVDDLDQVNEVFNFLYDLHPVIRNKTETIKVGPRDRYKANEEG